MDYKARFYSPRLGRFTQPDTLVPGRGSQSFNRYTYVMNNPIMMIDPSGHCTRKMVRLGICTQAEYDALNVDGATPTLPANNNPPASTAVPTTATPTPQTSRASSGATETPTPNVTYTSIVPPTAPAGWEAPPLPPGWGTSPNGLTGLGFVDLMLDLFDGFTFGAAGVPPVVGPALNFADEMSTTADTGLTDSQRFWGSLVKGALSTVSSFAVAAATGSGCALGGALGSFTGNPAVTIGGCIAGGVGAGVTVSKKISKEIEDYVTEKVYPFIDKYDAAKNPYAPPEYWKDYSPH